jgi:Ca2+:H+ antiporter
VALRQGLTDVVKASLAGSIIGNVLLVMGLAFLSGGIRHKSQSFNASAAQAQVARLVLVSVALIVPGVFHYLSKGTMASTVQNVSIAISVVLLATYALNLVFSLYTHKQFFSGTGTTSAEMHSDAEARWGLRRSIGILIVSTVLIAWMSEILVGSVSQAAEALGMSSVFVGVIVVAMVGNAAEHSSAVMMALKDRMDLSLGIAIGSSVQIALFVAPFLVLLSYAVAPAPMDMVFTLGEVLAVIMTVSISGHVMTSGQSNWFMGVLLLAVYVILGLSFYFVPGK